MIISASRRSDIPAFYMEWFLNRLKQGEALVRNPMRYTQVRTVALTPEHVEGIVFWSKNPAPVLDCLEALRPYPFYILFSLNPYGSDVEPNLPAEERRIETFLRLAEALGSDRLVWRYDPVLLTGSYSDSFHLENFERLAGHLSGATNACKISFVHPYQKINKCLEEIGVVHPTVERKITLGMQMQALAKKKGIVLGACCDVELVDAGIAEAVCVDAERLEKISGRRIKKRRDSGQRGGCTCCQSADVGVYDTCTHGCIYCYANRSLKRALDNRECHDPLSPFLSGR